MSNRTRFLRRRSALWAIGLILSLLLNSVPLSDAAVVARAPSLEEADPPPGLRRAPASFALYLPLIVRAGLPSPGDDLVVSWAQTTAGSGREVLLHWRSSPVGGQFARTGVAAMVSYGVDRRIAGAATWQVIGSAGFAPSVAEMRAILGADLTEQLGYDLGGAFEDPLTAQEVYDLLRTDPATAQILAQRYYQVGLVVGTSFLDRAAPGGVTLEYRVRDLGAAGRPFQPASVPSTPLDAHPPFDLRETWTGPAGLGQAPSSRPANAPERYSWQTTSDYMPWDGKVYLIWDTPQENVGNDGKEDAARKALNIAGYRVYRSPHGAGRWTSVNPRKSHCVSALLCELLVGVAPGGNYGPFPTHYFVDDLHTSSPDRGDVYDTWDYKVCAVDGLQSDLACSKVLVVNVRELQPPELVADVTATVPADQSKVTITWTYSDALELSPPLRFYVTSSPTLTTPLEDWTVVWNGNLDYVEIANTGPAKKTLTDLPPYNQITWYRVQVRDAAGNWSLPSTPVKAARYTRTAPALPAIPYNAVACENNPLPFTLGGLASNIFLINLYRSFEPGGPFELVERFEVTQTPQGNSVVIDDDYLPPYPAYAYYRLEAVDDHGNVSTARPYCAQLGDGPLMDPGLPGVTTAMTCPPEGECTFTASVSGPNAGDPPVDGEVTQPGEDGVPVTSTFTMTDDFTMDVNGGAWINLRSWYGYGEPTISNTLTTYARVVTNEFLDSNRNLEYLGGLLGAEWLTDTSTTPPTHYVRVHITGDDSPSVPVAIFRHAEHGQWMQVSPVGSLQPHYFDDRSDPSPDEQYTYLVLALSPTTYELLGMWAPVIVPPFIDTPVVAKLSSGISPPAPVSTACDKNWVAGGPSPITLDNGWQLQSVGYWIADDHDPDCPAYTQVDVPDLNHAYGTGTLSNGTQTWSNVDFQDIAINGSSVHTGGRIVHRLAKSYTHAGGFALFVGDVEFTATNVRAEVDVTLPSTIKVDIPDLERAGVLFGVVRNLTTSWRFDPLSLPEDSVIIDESLPWQLLPYRALLDESVLELEDVTTAFRGTISGRLDRPDSNLALFRPTYEAARADITVDGLKGDFAAGDQIAYATSFPAEFVIRGAGAFLSISDSEVQSGEIYKAQAFLDYDAERTSTDYVVRDHYCDTEPRTRYSLCEGFLNPLHLYGLPTDLRELALTPGPLGRSIQIGRHGSMSATVTMDRATVWPSFVTDPGAGTLFIAPAVFPDAPTSWGPMPAEVAWQHIPDPKTGGNFEPGLNLNSGDETIEYFAFDPPAFDGSAMNLYVRKGGVSGHIIMTDSGPRTNLWGYSENVQRVELVFLDNKALDPPEEFITDLTLPYPTDATLPLFVAQTDTFNRPLAGGFRDGFTDLTHRYWAFAETPTSWVYAVTTAGEYTQAVQDRQPRVLQMQSSAATVAGLQPANAGPSTADVELIFNSDWLPDGDIGTLRLLQPVGIAYRTASFRFILSAVKLSRYHAGILDPASNPSTLGIDLDETMDSLPEELLDGNGNLTGASLAHCAATTRDRCGLVVLDGDIGVDYFGEVKNDGAALQSITADIPAVDALVGEFPLAVNIAISVTKFVGIKSGYVPWVWPVLNQVLDVDLPIKFLGNTEGGILVALGRNVPVFPDEEIFRADVAGIVDIRWDLSTGYNDQVGIYLGYGASQAAFRALAQNRPSSQGGIRPYDRWTTVSSDVTVWAEKFGYTRVTGEANDAVDLAMELWEGAWCNAWSGNTCTDRVPYNEVFEVVEPILKGLGGTDAYGVTGVQEGAALQDSRVALSTGTLTAVLRRAGLGLELTQLEGGVQIQWDIWDYTVEFEDWDIVEIDCFIRADWLRFEMDRDGEIEVFGDTYTNLIEDLGVDAYLHALATPVGDEWRFEGVVDAEPIGLAGLSALELDGTYGSGPYEVPGTGAIEYISYFGGNFEAYFSDYRVGGGFLYGVIPQESAILREAGFGEILDTLGNQGSYLGLYAYLFGDFPLAGDNCLLEASAGGEIRFWYYWSDEIWGGTLTGFVHATVACVISARGQLELGYARLDNGGEYYNRTCTSSTCDVFGGSFWIATGIGWCSPSTWHRWRDRWWGDDWCYTFGAYVDLSYMEPGGIDYSYDLDFE